MITATLNGRALYAKGTMDVKLFDPASNDMVYYSNKMSTSQLTSTINLGAINAGPGNPVVIQIPDTPSLTMNLTAADFSLEGRALSAGSNVVYNGVVPVDEVVQADGTTLTVTQTPVYPLGGCDIVGYVNNSGTAYQIDPTTRELQGFTATAGQTYCVHYYTNNASAKQFGVDTLMNPAVVRGFITIPVYSTEGTTANANTGSRVGSLYITIPRGQLSGDVSTEGSQTTPATTIMNLTALSYDEACEQNIQCGTAASPKLAYMVLELYGNPDQNVEELAIVGGNDITVVAGTPYTIPVKYMMDNGEIVTPDLSNFTYTPEEGEAFFSVSPAGVITGTSDGTASLTIASKYNTDLTVTANVTVEGGGPATPTGNVSFTLTTPASGSGNELTGGGASYTVGVSVVNGTNSVVITGAKTAAQVIAVTGTNANLVTPGGTGTAPTYTVDTTSIGTSGGAVNFTLNVTEPGYTSLSYEVTVTVAAPAPITDTADVDFALTTPTPDGSNTINGGGANKTVTVNVANATASVVLTATKTAAQSIAVGGTDQGDVTPAPNDTNPTYTVNTSSIQAAGGSKTFTLTVSEASHNPITYNVTVTVAAPPPVTADMTFALTTPPDDSATSTLTGGGATRDGTVNVANTTSSVVITGTKTAAQSVDVGGTNSGDVTPGGGNTDPTYTVNTTDVATAGGSKTFTLTVSEADHTSIVYNVTVTVAGA